MKISKKELKQIVKEEVQGALKEDLNEGFVDWVKGVFGIAKPTEDSETYLARVAKALQNAKGEARICNGHQVICPEKRCSPLCGKNHAVMEKRINSYARRAVLSEKKKTKISKAGQSRVSKKIGILIGKEKMDSKQAAAMAYSMEKSGKLTKHGQYKKSKKKKKKS